MSSDDRSPVPNTKYLINRRSSLAGAHVDSGERYSRFLSQYGENAVEPAMRPAWNFNEAD